jgi:hypothetical protein
MLKRALWVGGFCGSLSVGCSSPGTGGDAGAPDAGAGGDAGAPDGATIGTNAKSLAGTWDLTTTPMGNGSGLMTTVTIGQDSLTVSSPDFLLTATRSGSALTFTDEQTPGIPNNDVVLTATQTAAQFNAGVLPFDLSGSWTMQIVPTGKSTFMTCTLTVSATEIDGSCQYFGAGTYFTFTTAKIAAGASVLGDFGGTWNNTWVWPGANGGTFPCKLDFTGDQITTCPGGVTSSSGLASPLAGITFTYDEANTISGAVQAWAEYSAARQ